MVLVWHLVTTMDKGGEGYDDLPEIGKLLLDLPVVE